jgi:hypothetical protein
VPTTSVVIAGKRKGELRRIGLTSLVQSNIDPTRMAQILRDAAMEQLHKERDERDRDQVA